MRITTRFIAFSLFAILAGLFVALITMATHHEVKFKVRIENISSPDGQPASNGSKWPFAISPGIWAVHSKNIKLFNPGEKASGKGLEHQAEDGNPEQLGKSLKGLDGVMAVGIFNTPVAAKEAGPVIPGGAYEFTVTATEGARLSFAMMFGQSNDLFYAPKEGIKLFDDNGTPIRGDITKKIVLWDAGTEVNQEPGIGPDQAPRQAAPNTGASEGKSIRDIKKVKDGFSYPKTMDVLRIIVIPEEMQPKNNM